MRIARFELRRMLGKGAQSQVHLAWDPQLAREVAIKTLRLTGQAEGAGQALIAEARAVSRLRHPHIVPVFEAGEHAGEPYLVFEYVEGGTLAGLIRREGALPPERAAAMMADVLDALQHAHDAGLIHRDLKPSNILVGADGSARVMDFGIAVRVEAAGRETAALVGSPCYMAPEYIAGAPPSAAGDVFAAGLVLFEMLFGRRAITASDNFQALHQIANHPVELPAAAAGLDERLRDLLAKALARDPAERWPSAAHMRDALSAYLRPAAGPTAGGGTLDFLLRRMRHKSDFPALSTAVGAVNRLTRSEGENVNTVANAILKDVALTSKILRLVNSAFYRPPGASDISTISRAVVVLGLDAIRNIAVSLILFEHLGNKQHAGTLREEFLRAILSSTLARELALAHSPRDAEEAFICALFHRLGRLLTHYYLPEEAAAIARLAQRENLSDETAAGRVLGQSFQDLGMGVARAWGFPDTIVASMRRVAADENPVAKDREGRLRTLSALSSELCDTIDRLPKAERAREFDQLRRRYREAISLSQNHLDEALEKSTREFTALAQVLRVSLKETRIGRQLQGEGGASAAPAAATAAPGALQETGLFAQPPAQDGGEGDAQSILSAGIQDISNALVEEFSVTDLLRIILETMYRAMGFQRVLICVRDARSNFMQGRFGLGGDADDAARRLRFAVGGQSDIFNLALARGVDVLISDANAPDIERSVPEWFRRNLAAATFLLLPLRLRNVPVALIYADKQNAGSIVVSEKELALLRTLRNQALLALKH
ncbi:MAG: HDOD domain-containing protein [Rhodocyclaceae bacterium]|nr:HDOD domain-containing protein [Rhodocyclaceae bacterium]